MNNILKTIILILIVAASLIIISYGAYTLYNLAIKDATSKIRKGVSEGIGDGIGQAFNPLNITGKLFGN